MRLSILKLVEGIDVLSCVTLMYLEGVTSPLRGAFQVVIVRIVETEVIRELCGG